MIESFGSVYCSNPRCSEWMVPYVAPETPELYRRTA